MPNGIPDANGHTITIAQAKTMINSRNNPPAGKKIDGSVTGVIFNKSIFQTLVNNNDCAAIRFYFAFAEASVVAGAHANIGTDDLVPTLVVVGVDANGKDMLSSKNNVTLDFGFENSWPYPLHGPDPGNLIPG